MEELGDHGAHAAEMSGPGAAIELIAESLDMHHGGGSGGIHLIGGGSEDNLHAFGFQPGAVGFQSAGVSIEILTGAELQWIDKYRYNDQAGRGARPAHQREVALMQCSHGGNKADGESLDSGGAAGGLHFAEYRG